MAYFAKIENGIVTQVIVAEKDHIDTLPGEWVETFMDGEKNYAGIGHFYNKKRDAFIPPKLYNSWKLDETKCNWAPPITRPNELASWDEESETWIQLAKDKDDGKIKKGEPKK